MIINHLKIKSLTIREIKSSEKDFLNEMLYTALFVEKGQSPLPSSVIKDPNVAKYISNFGSKQSDVCLVALEKNQLIGACWARVFDYHNQGFGFIDSKTPELSIAIKPEFRNKGVGTLLIKKIIVLYRERKTAHLSLSVHKNNAAIRLYTRIGFYTIKELKSSVIMRIDLAIR